MDAPLMLQDVLALVDCGSLIVRQCERRDLGNARLSSSSLRSAVDESLDSVEVIADAESAGKLLRRLPSLRQLQTDRLFSGLRSYTEVLQLGASLQQQLASLTRLTSISVSSSDLQHLGHLKWAHRVLQEATRSCRSSSSSSSSNKSGRPSKYYTDEYAALAHDSQHLVYWLPDWLGAAPGLTSLAVKSPTHISSFGRFSRTPGTPACLWMDAAAWASKLTTLDIQGVPLGAWLPPSIPQLTGLTSLRLQGCGLEPRAAAVLVRQVGASCKSLQVLRLSRNELWQLPREGWEGLAGLKELDLSHNSLAVLPGGISCLTCLTGLRVNHNQLSHLPLELTALSSLALFDASHNWPSGLRGENSADLASLVAAWPCLHTLALTNTSDKHGSLALPQELAGCSGLQELVLGHNYDLDWASLRVLAHCKALRVVDLAGMRRPGQLKAVPPDISQLLAQLQPRVAVQWDCPFKWAC